MNRGDSCPECPKSNWDKVRGNRHQRGYGKEWTKLRLKILKRDNYLCQAHQSKGQLVSAKEVDHIISKAKGGTDDPSNLQSLCVQCHREKTARDNGKKGSGCNADGAPLDPDHHWNI